MTLELVKAAANLTTEMLVTVTTESGVEHRGRVGRVDNRDKSVRATVLDSDTRESLGTIVCVFERDSTPVFQRAGSDVEEDCLSIQTHGIDVDWEAPVRNEGGLTYVVDCEECGGLMKRDGQHWPRSSESYACTECDNSGRWRRRSDAVRYPTRREWAVHTLERDSAFISIPEKYIPEGYELPGYYFREACANDASHYTRTEVSETGSATSHLQFTKLRLGTCPECGAETTSKTLQYQDGCDTWGEPENHGGLPEDFVEIIERIEDGETELKIPNDPEEAWGYTYEGVLFSSPWHGFEDGVVIRLKEGELFMDVVNKGGTYIGGSRGTALGEVAWWFKNTEAAKEMALA